VAGDRWSSWVNPTSVVAGLLAVSLSAYLAAVFLVTDARRLADDTMAEYFRRRAVGAAVAAGAVGHVGVFVLSEKAVYVFDGLTSRAQPVVLLSLLCGIGALVLLLRRVGRGSRLAAVVAVAAVITAWAVAQWDYLLPTTLTVSAGAAPDGTIFAVLVATGLGAAVLLPSFGLLYVLDQKSLLPEEGASEPVHPSTT
jgi:cytochrome d ubiquinol oxidase subunit II